MREARRLRTELLRFAMDLAQNHLFSDICSIIENGRRQAYAEVSRLIIETYWKIGQRIVEEEQKGNKRAEYGAQLFDALSTELTHKYGKGFSKRNLAYFRTFYQIFPDIEILQSRLQNLTWTHLTKVFRVEDPVAIRWYLTEAARELSKIFFDKIPAVEVSDAIEQDFSKLVNDIQQTYSKQKAIHIDQVIFDLYGLTEDERAAVGFIEL